MLFRHQPQCPPRPHLQQDSLWVSQQLAHSIGKPYRLAHVPRPIIRIDSLCFRHPSPSDIRNVRDLRFPKLQVAQQLAEGPQHRIHHCRMKGMRRGKPAARDPALLEHTLEVFDGSEGSGYNTH